ncbi:hypothetical protein [Amycolatopsis sp. 195334CR]|uniref:hypothetical protein n=1 Tax=Amycolatopsis sp. 195334CR TaxID=2814588 RepID=UPI001A8D30A0|nr:hypothetical protein [Amycolatopsis sp. 195334CR]MBN6040248.1 hypothetical protein [Amycolatopsis sp. 195334CR]
MSEKRLRRVLATAVFGAALAAIPAGPAVAAEPAAACAWQKTVWDLPPGAEIGEVDAYDGSRYAVGITGLRPLWGDGVADPRGTLWDNGKVVFRADTSVPHLRDVNASGLVIGDTVVDGVFHAVTVGHGGQVTKLPANPAWTSSSAWAVNNAGDVAGWADAGSRLILVVWPGNAPGTYRELPTPQNLGYHHLADLDEQGRVIVQTDAGTGGYVVDPAGQWRVLASMGADGSSTPWGIRGGRVVGSVDGAGSYAAAEWNARGELVRTIRTGLREGVSLGGNGTIAGYGSQSGVVLWRDGAVVAQPITTNFTLAGLSDDERTIAGVEAKRPSHYRCS